MLPTFPRDGGCLCGDIRFRLGEDPLTLYVCHCTDCQTQSGASFSLSMIVRREALQLLQGEPGEYQVELPDGRVKKSSYCERCSTRLFSPSSRSADLTLLEPGCLDDTSWVQPVAHIWTRSAQAWISIPKDLLQCAMQPSQAESLEFVRRWKQRGSPPAAE